MSQHAGSAAVQQEAVVVLADPIRPEEVPWWQMVVGDQARLVTPPVNDENGLAQVVGDAVAIICREGRITARLMDIAPKLRLIEKIGWAGNNVDMEAAEERGIRVDVTLNPLRVPVAEHAILLMLVLSKELIPAHMAVMRGENPQGIEPFETAERVYAYNWLGQTGIRALFRQTLGLIGMGEIGTGVARRARAFQMKVLYTDARRLPPHTEEAEGVEFVPMDELLRRSDYVSLHVPFTESTRHLIGEAQLAMMKPSAFLINTSRGGVVDQQALARALENRQIAGAGLDVFEKEPLVGHHEFADLPNVVLTPHISAVREETMGNMLPEVGENIAQAIRDMRAAEG